MNDGATNIIAAGQRVRYVEILDSAPGGWRVRFTCCGTLHHRTDVQIRRVINTIANRCNKCRIEFQKNQSIVKLKKPC